jgi:hypothetical protein
MRQKITLGIEKTPQKLKTKLDEYALSFMAIMFSCNLNNKWNATKDRKPNSGLTVF